jgi:Aromatic acid exporter family member 1
MTTPRAALARATRSSRLALSQAGPERDTFVLLCKAALATVLAWQFAVRVLHSPTPFYAPMAALLVVDRTMVRSLWAGVQRIAAVVLGMSVAWAVGSVAGVSWWSIGPVIFFALLLGRWSRLGDHGLQVPAMVLLSLLTVGGTSVSFTSVTILETLIGGAIGVITNAVVLAPLHLRRPREQVVALARQVHELLHEMSQGLRGDWGVDLARHWYRVGGEIASDATDVVGEISTGRESTRLNPRHNIRPVRVDWEGYESTVEALHHAQWQITGIARTLVDAADDRARQPAPSPHFLARYADALDALADIVTDFGLRDDEARARFDRQVGHAEEILAALREVVRATPLEDAEVWPVYGSLITDAQRAVRELDSARSRAVLPTVDGHPIRAPRSGVIRGRIRWPARSRAPGHRSTVDLGVEDGTCGPEEDGHRLTARTLP